MTFKAAHLTSSSLSLVNLITPFTTTIFQILTCQQVDKSTINIFCSSKLWQGQLVTGQPKAIQESQFVVPGAVSSAEGRRNYTDVQETAQWLGGIDVPTQILKDLLNRALDSIMFGSHIIVA